MGKKAARRVPAAAGPPAGTSGTTADAVIPPVGAREPCPCGSGRRYKACHGRAAFRESDVLVRRPFAGLPGECDWVALREVVPAATAPLTLVDPLPAGVTVAGAEAADGLPPVVLATVLPLAWPALRRADGAVVVGLQVPGGSGDVSRDVAAALLTALAAEPGTPAVSTGRPGPGPRLQDLLDPAAPLEVTVHAGFDFWLEGVPAAGPDVAASMERANAAVVPTERLTSVEAAYWCRIGERNSLRWVLPYDEEPLLDALARLRAAGQDGLGPGSRYVGSFRAHGLLVPVWDLAPGTPAAAVEEPAAAFEQRLAAALAETGPLDEGARRARPGLLSRQVTLR